MDDYPTRYGMWLDHRPSAHTQEAVDAWADEIASWGIAFGSIDLNTGTGDLHVPNYNRDTLALMTQALRIRGITTRWMVRPVPTPEAIEETTDALSDLYGRVQALGVNPNEILPELDLEENWKPAGSDESIAALLIDSLTALPPVLFVAINFVVRLSGVLDPYIETVAKQPAVQLAILQSYCFYGGQGHWSDAAPFRPGGSYLNVNVTQALEMKRALLVSTVHFGQALYGQSYPDPYPKGEDALQVTYDTLRTLLLDAGMGVTISGWSSRNARNNGFTDWVRSITGGQAPMEPPTTKGVQYALQEQGYYHGNIDGLWGDGSKAAHKAYTEWRQISVTEDPTLESCKALLKHFVPPDAVS